MDNPSKDQILAASSGWIATTLNFFPGLGTGYIYQRRWLPYFITLGVATGWFILGAVVNGDSESTRTQQLIGIGGLFLISITSMIEAKISHIKAIKILEKQLEAKPQKIKRGLFR